MNKIVNWHFTNKYRISQIEEFISILRNQNFKYSFLFDKFFSIKNIGVDPIDHSDKNFFLFRWSDIVIQKNTMDDFYDILDFCDKNSVFLIIDNSRESIFLLKLINISNILKKYQNLNYKIICGLDNNYYDNYFDFFMLFKDIKQRLNNKDFNLCKVDYKNIKKKYFFTSLIGNSLKSHRATTLLFLKFYKLIENNFISNFTNYNVDQFYQIEKELELYFYKKYKLETFVEDNKKLIYTNNYFDDDYFNNTPDELLKKGLDFRVPNSFYHSYFNLVVETFFDISFFTEKIAKPIMCGIPFYLIGTPEVFSHFKSLGFENYEELFDYDIDFNMFSGIDSQIQCIKNLEKENRNIFFQKIILDKIEHNYNNFLNLTSDERILEDLLEIYLI